jgi:hypothetical protein
VGQQDAPGVPDDATDVVEEAGLEVGVDSRGAVLGAEDQVVMKGDEGLGHRPSPN